MARERPMTEMSLQDLLMSAFPRGPCQSHRPSAGPVAVVWHNWQSRRRKWQDPSEDGDWIHTSSHPVKGNFSRSAFRWIKGTAFGRGPSAHPRQAVHPAAALCARRELRRTQPPCSNEHIEALPSRLLGLGAYCSLLKDASMTSRRGKLKQWLHIYWWRENRFGEDQIIFIWGWEIFLYCIFLKRQSGICAPSVHSGLLAVFRGDRTDRLLGRKHLCSLVTESCAMSGYNWRWTSPKPAALSLGWAQGVQRRGVSFPMSSSDLEAEAGLQARFPNSQRRALLETPMETILC